MASPEHHRSTAESLLDKAQSYGPSAAARLSTLMEAQIHATLYAAEITAAANAPAPAAPKAPAARRKATAAKTEEAAK